MPLTRCALFYQNINLYLAPTADQRDAWLSLMRTIALEGRCFVVSSNMCVRGSTSSPVVGQGISSCAGRRRNSCLTEDGFEIALPASKKGAVGSGGRRRSVFDKDGNEIVLSSSSSPSEKPPLPSSVAAVAGATPVFEETAAASAAVHHHAHYPVAKEFVSRGGSCIVSPLGDVLAGPQWEDDEGIIYAHVDFDDCIRGRLDLDAAGSYSRNDSFKFSVEGLDLDPLPY